MALYYRQSFLSGLSLFCLVISFNSLPEHGVIFPELINSGHAFVFFSANLFLLKLLFGSSANSKQIALVSMISLTVGILIEIVQPYFGRNRSAIDLYYDVVGICFSSIFYLRKNSSPKKTLYSTLIFFVCLASAIPAFRLWLWWQINQSPTLLNFERNWESYSYSIDREVSLERIPATNELEKNNHIGELRFGISTAYPGFSLDHPKTDWSTYKTLSWEISSKHDHIIKMNLRVHDRNHNQEYSDRFNYRFEVKPGLNKFKLSLKEIKTSPESRIMEMDKIQNIKFFLTKPKVSTTIYIDNVQLQ